MRIKRIAIDSVDDRRVGDFRIVSDPVLMRERGLFVAEGRLAVERLLASRFRAQALLLTGSVLARLEPALAACRVGAGGPDVYLTDSARLRVSCLVKKETVMGTMGKTQGVRRARKPMLKAR